MAFIRLRLRVLSTRPTLRTPVRALYPSAHAYINDPSKLACCPSGVEADSSPTARFDAHRLVKIRLVPCVRWASKGDEQPPQSPHLSSTSSVDKPVHEELFISFFSLPAATDDHIA